MKAKVAESLFRRHEQYWDKQKKELRKLRAAYMTRYWDNDYAPDQILIETTRAYEYIAGALQISLWIQMRHHGHSKSM